MTEDLRKLQELRCRSGVRPFMCFHRSRAAISQRLGLVNASLRAQPGQAGLMSRLLGQASSCDQAGRSRPLHGLVHSQASTPLGQSASKHIARRQAEIHREIHRDGTI